MDKKNNKTLFEALKNLTLDLLDSNSQHLIKLIEDWNTIIPTTWNNSYPIKLKWEKNNTAVLYVMIKNKYALNLLTYDEANMIDKINEYFGYNCIAKIKFKAIE